MTELTPQTTRIGVRQRWCEGRVLVVTLCGELDMVTSPEVVGVLDAAHGKRPAALIVDLTEVSFLGSAAMTALLSAQRDTGELLPLVVVADGPVTARPLRLVGVDRVLTVVPSLERALAHLADRYTVRDERGRGGGARRPAPRSRSSC